jgi:Zn-dependent M32 family carboxypeptidase
LLRRYEIERGLISGDVKVEDIPKLWNAKMQQVWPHVQRWSQPGSTQQGKSGWAQGQFVALFLLQS